MSTQDLQLDALAKASRRAAMLSLSGVVIVLASLAYGSFRLYALRSEIADLETTKKGLGEDVGKLQDQLKSLQNSIQSLSYAKVTPQNEVFQVQATAKARPGVINPDGNGVYDFSIFINGSKELLSKIEKVTYDFDHPTFRKPHQEASDRNSKFLVQYVGWGCLTQVGVTVYMKDGTKQSIPFDMCKSLGGDWDR